MSSEARNSTVQAGRLRLPGLCLVLFLAAAAGPWTLSAQQSAQNLPKDLDGVRIEQRLNEQLPLDLEFRDSQGRTVRLGDYFDSRAVLIAPVYYECPMLCSMVLQGLVRALKVVSLEPGRDYEIVTVSFDFRETPGQAAKAKERYAGQLRREGAERGWHFLTGEREDVEELMSALGFHYRFIEEQQQYSHASAVIVATPEGKLSRYFYGVEYTPRDLKFGLMEASNNQVGSPVDQVLLYCFHYDPITGKYGFVIMNALRLFGALTVAAIVLFIVISLRRERRERFFQVRRPHSEART